MNPRTFITIVRRQWQSTPGILRWNGGTLVAVGFLAAAVHAISSGPAASRADLTQAVVTIDRMPAAVRLKPSATTQPAERNLFSLDWQRSSKTSASPTTAPDDPGFWNDVATPLKGKTAGGVR